MPKTIQELQAKTSIDPDFFSELAKYLSTTEIRDYKVNKYLEVNGVTCTIWFDEQKNAHLSKVNSVDCDIRVDY